MNIWKIGAWPGIWEDNKENRQKFASEYAIPYDFIALGSGYLPDVKDWTIEEIKNNICEKRPDKTPLMVDDRAVKVDYFANKMKIQDIVILYVNDEEAYIGEIISDYYYVGKKSKLNFIENTTGYDYAPHRRDVTWKYKDRYNKAKRFSDIGFDKMGLKGAVHEIEENHISDIENSKVKEYLRVVLTQPYLVNE